MGCFGEPPNILYGILHADPAHGYPFSRDGHFGWVIPEALLGQVKVDFLDQCDQKFEMVDGPGWGASIVAASDVQDEAAVVTKNPVNFFGERNEPFDVILF